MMLNLILIGLAIAFDPLPLGSASYAWLQRHRIADRPPSPSGWNGLTSSRPWLCGSGGCLEDLLLALLEVGFCDDAAVTQVSQLGELVGGAGLVRCLLDIGAERAVLFLGLGDIPLGHLGAACDQVHEDAARSACYITVAIGYGLGVFAAWTWRAFADQDPGVRGAGPGPSSSSAWPSWSWFPSGSGSMRSAG